MIFAKIFGCVFIGVVFILPLIAYNVGKWGNYGCYAGKSLWRVHRRKYKQ